MKIGSFEERKLASSLIERIISAQADIYLRFQNETDYEYLKGFLDGYSSVLHFLSVSMGTQKEELKRKIVEKL